MKKILGLQALIGLAGVILGGALSDGRGAASAAIGVLIMLANVLLHSLVWTALVRKKKLVAFAVLIIVFKYAILSAIIFKLLGIAWISLGWFSAGVGSFVISVLIVALTREEHVI